MSEPTINGGYEPLQASLPAYPYLQYSDDDDISAFFTAYTQLAQSYLDWFNANPLSVYTNPSISGELLDWTGEGIYGMARPVISTQSTTTSGSLTTEPLTYLALTEYFVQTSGTSVVATDDLYKRSLTWNLFSGDGKQMSVIWLRRRIARFLYGANGQDFDVGYLSNISITQGYLALSGPLTTEPLTYEPLTAYVPSTTYARGVLDVTLPDVAASKSLIALLEQGILALPFQISLLISITGTPGYVAFIPAGSSGLLTNTGATFLVRP